MKCFIVLNLVIAAALATPEKLFVSQWTSFKATYNKQYSTTHEESRRLAIFKESLVEIEEHNARYAKGEVSYFQKVTKFSDWTKEEFADYLKRGKNNLPKIYDKLIAPIEFDKPLKALADSVDWRDKGAVTEVKDEGNCSCSWSFSSVGLLEGQLAIQYNKLVSLSAQQLVDCTTLLGNAGCYGGWPENSMIYLLYAGINSEEDYPYESARGQCREDRNNYVAQIKNYNFVRRGNQVALANVVETMGPVSVTIDATDAFRNYGGGVLDDSTCTDNDLNHSALIVGFGTENNQDYFLVKNSWGTGWGEEGYFKIIRNKLFDCGISQSALVVYLK